MPSKPENETNLGLDAAFESVEYSLIKISYKSTMICNLSFKVKDIS
jgi:hypothetical protein